MNNTIGKTMIVVILIICAVLLVYEHAQQFKNDHNLTIGKVVKCDGGGKGNFGPGIYYEYYNVGKMHKGSTRNTKLPYNIGKSILGKSFPVVYKEYWYGYANTILITPEDFKAFGYSFPDSLKWVLPYMNR